MELVNEARQDQSSLTHHLLFTHGIKKIDLIEAKIQLQRQEPKGNHPNNFSNPERMVPVNVKLEKIAESEKIPSALYHHRILKKYEFGDEETQNVHPNRAERGQTGRRGSKTLIFYKKGEKLIEVFSTIEKDFGGSPYENNSTSKKRLQIKADYKNLLTTQKTQKLAKIFSVITTKGGLITDFCGLKEPTKPSLLSISQDGWLHLHTLEKPPSRASEAQKLHGRGNLQEYMRQDPDLKSPGKKLMKKDQISPKWSLELRLLQGEQLSTLSNTNDPLDPKGTHLALISSLMTKHGSSPKQARIFVIKINSIEKKDKKENKSAASLIFSLETQKFPFSKKSHSFIKDFIFITNKRKKHHQGALKWSESNLNIVGFPHGGGLELLIFGLSRSGEKPNLDLEAVFEGFHTRSVLCSKVFGNSILTVDGNGCIFFIKNPSPDLF